MLRFGNAKHRSFRAARIVATVFLAVATSHAKAGPNKPLHSQTKVSVPRQTPQDAVVINSACDKLLRGDFESAQDIVSKSTVSHSKSLRELRKVIDECLAIKARLKAWQHRVYQTQINELEKLRQKGFSDDVSDINKVFSIVLTISEYADKEQKKALLRDPLVLRTVKKAKAKAAEFEAKGRWLDSYTTCYSKLKEIYKDKKVYSDYAEQLLEKADILTSLQDNPCETCQERYAGVEKRMFIKAVEFLDSRYISIVNYQAMTTKAVTRCKLLGEVISNSDIETSYKIENTRYEGWSNALKAILDEVIESPADISKDKFIDVFEQVLVLNESPHLGIGLSPVLLITQFAKGGIVRT